MPVNDFTGYPMSWRPQRIRRGDGPVYLSLASALSRDISEGRLLPGTRLPPQRELADYLDLNFTTVTRAYDLCRERGLVYGVTGRGTFVASNTDADIEHAAEAADLGVVQGFPGLGCREVVKSAQAVLAGEGAGRLFTYGAREGRLRPREAGRLWIARRGIAAAADRIVVFPGAQGVLSSALFSLFGVGDALAVDEFTYGNLIALAKMARVKLVAVPGDMGGMLPGRLDDAARTAGVRGVFLMPDCANPTARSIPGRRRAELAEVVRRRDLLVLEDDAHLGAGGRKTMCELAPERTVYIAGSTRHLSPGLRVTFACCPETVRARLVAGLHHTAIKASALDAEILAEMILGGEAEVVVGRKRRAAECANAVFGRVFGVGKRLADARLFRTVPLSGTAGRGRDIERKLSAMGVLAFHSDRFRVGGVATDAFLRVSISNARGVNGLERDLGRLKAALRNLRA